MSKKYLKNTQGYSLLITLGLIVTFTILGLSLMTLTMSGTAKNNNRESNTQALNYAEKGQDFIINKTSNQLMKETELGLSNTDFTNKLEQLTQPSCTFDSNGNLISGTNIPLENTNDSSIACIKANPNVIENGIENKLKKKLEIVSVGKASDKKQVLTTFVEVGATVPEQMEYTLSTKKDGNINLNGAVQITGDLLVGGDLTTKKSAWFPQWTLKNWNIDSIYPSIKSLTSERNPQIFVNTDTKKSNLQSKIEHGDLFDLSVFDKPTVLVNNSVPPQVKISSQKSDYEFSSNSSGVVKLKAPWPSSLVPGGTYSSKTYLEHCTGLWCLLTSDNKILYPLYIFDGSYNFTNKLATPATIQIKNNGTNVNVNSLFINGNLRIGSVLDGLQKNKDDITLEGSIFVDGDLIMYNVDLTTNALIYVTGKVDIQNSTINSKNGNGSLVIFANKDISLEYNSRFSDTPSNMYGFFYSEKDIEIYGVESNMIIHGGISANNINLHAIRGSAQEKWGKNDYSNAKLQASTETKANASNSNLNCGYPDDNNMSKCYKLPSRLQVHYNEDVISTYLNLNKGKIYNVSSPKVIDRLK